MSFKGMPFPGLAGAHATQGHARFNPAPKTMAGTKRTIDNVADFDAALKALVKRRRLLWKRHTKSIRSSSPNYDTTSQALRETLARDEALVSAEASRNKLADDLKDKEQKVDKGERLLASVDHWIGGKGNEAKEGIKQQTVSTCKNTQADKAQLKGWKAEIEGHSTAHKAALEEEEAVGGRVDVHSLEKPIIN
jgi:hypothetical protein